MDYTKLGRTMRDALDDNRGQTLRLFDSKNQKLRYSLYLGEYVLLCDGVCEFDGEMKVEHRQLILKGQLDSDTECMAGPDYYLRLKLREGSCAKGLLYIEGYQKKNVYVGLQ